MSMIILINCPNMPVIKVPAADVGSITLILALSYHPF